MTYLYKCVNQHKECNNKTTEINKPMSESSKEEVCPHCGHIMDRVYTSPGIKTAGDGYKS